MMKLLWMAVIWRSICGGYERPPTICILDDHDVGHPNIWGEGGKVP